MRPTFTRPALLAATFLSLVACGGAIASPGPTPTPIGEAPTPTPVTVVVGSPSDAATLVLATDPRFTGIGPRMDNVVGQGSYWVATPLDGGRYRIDVTIGWGDCPAGCIDRHVWSYEVWPDGRVELISETGPEVPPDVQ